MIHTDLSLRLGRISYFSKVLSKRKPIELGTFPEQVAVQCLNPWSTIESIDSGPTISPQWLLGGMLRSHLKEI